MRVWNSQALRDWHKVVHDTHIGRLESVVFMSLIRLSSLLLALGRRLWPGVVLCILQRVDGRLGSRSFKQVSKVGGAECMCWSLNVGELVPCADACCLRLDL